MPGERHFHTIGPDVLEMNIEKIVSHLAADIGTVIQRHTSGFVDIQAQNPPLGFPLEFKMNEFQPFAFTQRHCQRLSLRE